ncbi:kinase-like domain-containing protein [Tricharina praecox]|uniref:kinase-like domain-containing protein n=1 Tax=Tricharina praecox TaxID=43433 RepID=UPI00221FB0D8|nr:kinase-like domain-containing protein [Tricharina praecox]KAI5851942.1 kinase-like domain-containing protein [Tricharina praecox]
MATRVERSLHAIKQFNTTFHKTSSVTESRRASASSSSGDSWENGFICERLRDRIHGFEKHITNSPTGLMRRVYPKNDVYRVLTCKNIRSLLQCPCEGKWCRGRMSPATEQKITTIFSEYRLIFAILLEMERLCLIHSFVELGFTDESVLAHPLQQSELEQVMDDAYIRHGIRDNHFWKTFHHHKQYEFLLPNIPALEKADADDIFTVNISRTLPINLKRQLGRGGYGDVYQAELLDGYHSLETIDGCVAVKIFRVSSSSGSEKSRDYDDEDDYYTGAGDWDDQDCAAETRNNKRFQHSNIVPMLASLSHGPENMSFYPIARTSLQALISEPTLTPPNNTTVRIVEQVADLFSALNQIHTGNENGCGYHLDIKPANILVRADDSFALTDLGMAHFKTHQEVQQDRSFSETRMRPCSEEYAGPELTGKRIHRSFDIWAMGAVFLELLVWIAEGRDGVRKFHNARKTKKDYKISPLRP